MKAERDYLKDSIFPAIRERAARRGVAVTALDLRWGIPEGTDLAETIEICLSEIDNSYPFFIGFLGAEYGTQPPAEIFEGSDKLKERFRVVSDYFRRHLSITEMEMRYGVIDNPEEKIKSLHALFFVRKNDAGKIKSHPHLSRLTADIESLARLSDNSVALEQYDSLRMIGESVDSAFNQILDRFFPISEGLGRSDMASFQREAIISELIRFYIPDAAEPARISEFVESGSNRTLHICGEAGTGKSALLAYWIRNNRDRLRDEGTELFYQFVGHDGTAISGDRLKELFIDEMVRRFDIQIPPGSKVSTIDEVLDFPEAKRKQIILIIDDVTRLSSPPGSFWIHTRNDNVKIIISSTPEFTLSAVHYGTTAKLTVRGLVDENRRRELIADYIHTFHRRRLETDNIRKILDWPLSVNPLALMTVLDELMSAGQYDRMSSIVEYYTSTTELYETLRNAILRMSSVANYEWTVDALGLIYGTVHGLTEHELLELTGVPQIFWSGFFCMFRRHFIVRNGLITIGHGAMREAVRSLLTDKALTDIHKRLLPLFSSPSTERALEEFFYQTYYSGVYVAETVRVMSDPMAFSHLYQWDSKRVDVMWQDLFSFGNKPEALIINSHDFDEKSGTHNFGQIAPTFGFYAGQVLSLCHYLALDGPALRMFEHYNDWSGMTALDIFPAFASVGHACFVAGNFAKALELLKKGILIDSSNPDNMFGMDLGYTDGDIPFDLGPGIWKERFFDMAECCRYMNDYAGACKYYTKAIEQCEEVLECNIGTEQKALAIALLKSAYLKMSIVQREIDGADDAEELELAFLAIESLEKAEELRFSEDDAQNEALRQRYLGDRFLAEISMEWEEFDEANNYYYNVIKQHLNSDWTAHNTRLLVEDFYNYGLSFLKCGCPGDALSCLNTALGYLKGYDEGYWHSRIYALMEECKR